MSWVEIFVIAMTAQLAVLPGEKVQFIIAGLSTRFNPWIVVAAAGSAFAGWTAIELVVGNALMNMLPGIYLELFTAGLFLLFAVLLWRSRPADRTPSEAELDAVELDVTILGYDIPPYLGGYLPIFAMMAAGEFGDKTQLVTIGLAAQYGAHPAIWFGEMAAIIPVSMVNAFFFHRFSQYFDLHVAHYVGATLFAFFGVDTLLAVFYDVSVWETVTDAIAQVVLSVL
ncbi:TMEM165/GDT1 family protein [Halodesulfurarchaeum sp. HSR-GB]|uniref:TMEM165/GDT1 family protein n=1 Tax=Halodesulfurarchaeum sp. HSR-GB TaxID=3074077 RepID=UPI00285426EE|nr:TMEM165/GDT1 family protein [Halodesulfurarchaeum sp. HSR-GB]MDR5656964.1 TMEM165/GDT1 family protein [Halodesulfurarchaeum sp. HSR-GB]